MLFFSFSKKAGIHFGKWMWTLCMVLVMVYSQAQVINVFRSSPGTGWQKPVSSGTTVGFPAVASGPATLQFTILNNSIDTLFLTGVPAITVSGPDSVSFAVVQPALSILPGNTSTTFSITYNAADSLMHTAQLSIPSNASDDPYLINLTGAGNLFFGARFPPPGPYPYYYTQSGNIGRPGGWNVVVNFLMLAANTVTYWGTHITSTGDLQMQLSMNGSGFSGNENFTYSPGESSLVNGSLVWRGNTILNTLYGDVFVYLKCMLTTTTNGSIPYPLADPSTLGLSEELGGLVHFTSITDNLNANFIILASTDNVTFTPYLDFYDNYPKKTCGSCAYVSLTEGFYWKDLRPALTSNNGLILPEGDTSLISTSNLNCTDAEDLPDNPQKLIFSFMTTAPTPLAFGTGTLMKNGVPMTITSTFTLEDLQNNLISFIHNGSETIHDEFQFSLKDGNGVQARDGIYTVFSFPVTITPVNDPPETRDTSYITSYATPVDRTLVASDPDNTNLTFSIVTFPSYGTITSFNAVTGEFSYLPTAGFPVVDSFTFNASDGILNSDTSMVTINLVNLPPVSQNISVTTPEEIAITGQLTATDPEGGPVTFQQIKASSKGYVITQPNGNFFYTPNATRMGTDYFTFEALDSLGNPSEEDTVFVHIIPRLDPGDILVADAGSLRLFDPATSQDTVLSKNGLLSQSINLTFGQGTSIFVYDAGTGLVKINPMTGIQTLLAPKSGFSTGVTGGPTGMVLNNTGKIIIADGPNGIVQVDSTTGIISPLFTGGLLNFPTAVAYLNNGDLVVADAAVVMGGTNEIVRITPGGIQTPVSSGGYLSAPLDLAVVDQNTIVVADPGSFTGGTDRILKIDLATGGQTVLTSGGFLSAPTGLDYYENNVYTVNNSGSKNLLQINYTSGTQTDITTEQMSQPWGLKTVPNTIPAAKTIQNMVIINGNSNCYNATQTITIAGGNTYFIVMNGGSATLIAGQKISIKTGTVILNGGYFHGYIAPGGPWCYTPSAPVILAETGESLLTSGNSHSFSVFPNPTTGNFRVRLKKDEIYKHISVQLFGLRGELFFENEMTWVREKEFTITNQPSGLYILRITSEIGTETFRLIKTDR